jgi:hypothetical protein
MTRNTDFITVRDGHVDSAAQARGWQLKVVPASGVRTRLGHPGSQQDGPAHLAIS